MQRSIQSLQAEVITILTTVKVNKSHIANQLIRYYPDVFLSIFNCEFDTFVLKTEDEEIIQARIESAIEAWAEFHRAHCHPATPEIIEKQVYAEELPDPCVLFNMTRSELPSWCKVILAAIHANLKIDAIKMVRKLTGVGLRESKEFCDNLQDRFPT